MVGGLDSALPGKVTELLLLLCPGSRRAEESIKVPSKFLNTNTLRELRVAHGE